MARRRDRLTAELKLRLPEPLRKQVEKAAKRNKTSLNTEMIRRLEESFGREGLLFIARGETWAPVQKGEGELYMFVGNDSPQQEITFKISDDDMTTLIEHFGVKK